MNTQQTQHIQSKTLKDYFILVYRNKGFISLIVFLSLVCAAYYILSTHPVYQSDAVVMIETKGGPMAVFDMGTSADMKDVANELEIMKSYTIAETMVRKLWKSGHRNNLYFLGTREAETRLEKPGALIKDLLRKWSDNPSDNSLPVYSETIPDSCLKKFTRKVRANLSVQGRRNTNIIDVSFTALDPEEAILLTNTYIEAYKEASMDWSNAEIKSLRMFLENQLEKQEEELAKAETRVQEFQEQNRIFGVEEQYKLLLENSSNIESMYNENEAEIRLKEHQKRFIESRLSEEEKTLAFKLKDAINSRLAALRLELGAKEAEFVRNSITYGENHEAVRGIKKDIETLKNRLEEETQRMIAQGISVADPLEYSQSLVAQLLSIESELSGYRAKSEELHKLLNSYDQQLASLPEKQLEFIRLERNRQVLEQTYSFMRQKYEESKISEASEVGKVRIIDYASFANRIKPDTKKSLLYGLVIGFILGFGLIQLRDMLDNTINTIEEVERTGLTFLGGVPEMSEALELAKKNGGAKSEKRAMELYALITNLNPKSPVAEAFRSIRTNISMASADKKIKSIIITSPGPAEGKTTIISNLAVTFANLGKRTLLVDADLRRSRIHTIFNLKRQPGLIQYLVGEVEDFDSVINSTQVENLSVVTSGGMPPNPSELLGSQKMAELVDRLESEYDMILIDSPPIVAVTDSTMISKEIDDIILVAKAGVTDRDAFRRAVTLLNQVEVPVGGIILNGITKASSYNSYYYYYQHYYYYGEGGMKKHRKGHHHSVWENFKRKFL